MITVVAKLPEGIKGFEYVKNHHWITLVDVDGNELRLNATGLVQYLCECKTAVFITSNFQDEMSCPSCAKIMEKNWVKPMLSFVAEDDKSKFMPPKQKDE